MEVKNNKINIGLFGYGCVGSGLYQVIQHTPDLGIWIKKICVKSEHKKRDLPFSHFTFDKHELLNDPTLQIIVELIDDADEAFYIVSEALKKGKHVVTANKKMVANHFKTLTNLAKKHGVSLLYEAAVAGSIPIIRTLEEYYNTDTLTRIEGILNGTTNYILTSMIQEKISYSEALLKAQELGFAESDPNADVDGFDPKFKLSILLAHAFGSLVAPEHIVNLGIKHLQEEDIHFANQHGYSLKLIASAYLHHNKVQAYVLPTFVTSSNPFYGVNHEFNAVQTSASFADKQLFIGKGAGSFPTAAAVLSDITALKYNYAYEYLKLNRENQIILDSDFELLVYVRYQNSEIFEHLAFSSIMEEFRSKSYKYIIGTIQLKSLIKADLAGNSSVFIALMPEYETGKSEPNNTPYNFSNNTQNNLVKTGKLVLD